MELLGLYKLYGLSLVCLAIIIMPSLLLMWTAAVIYRRRSFQYSWFLLLLNATVGFGIIFLVVVSDISTFGLYADISYRVVLFNVILLIFIGIYVYLMDIEIAENPDRYSDIP